MNSGQTETVGRHRSSDIALDFTITPEQQQLRDMTRRFMADHSSETAVRAVMTSEAGYNADDWQKLASETGLVGLLVPEQFGGSGLGIPDIQIVLQEMGRALYCGPYLATALMAVAVLNECGDAAAQARYLPAIAEGAMLMAVALEETGNPARNWTAVATNAKISAKGYRLTGSKISVIDGAIADSFLVLASTDAGPSLFHVDAGAAGLQKLNMPTFDLTRKLAQISFEDTPAKLLGTAGAGAEVIRHCHDLFLTGLAGEQLGAAQACLDMAVEYGKTRYQFGRAIGSFQAIKHKCADLLLQVEAAYSAAQYAALCAADDRENLAIAASMAKSYCSETLRQAAADNLQIHGGIGFTWEHSCHLYLKRAKSSELMMGDPLFYRQRLARLLEL